MSAMLFCERPCDNKIIKILNGQGAGQYGEEKKMSQWHVKVDMYLSFRKPTFGKKPLLLK